MDTPFLLMKKNNGINIDNSSILLDKEAMLVGRDDNADIQIRDPFISREQALFHKKKDSWLIRDGKSTNGTYLNGTRVGKDSLPLKQGDIINFSRRIEFVFQCGDEEIRTTMVVESPESQYGIEIQEKSEDVLIDGIRIEPRLSPLELQFFTALANEPDRIHTYKELCRIMYSATDLTGNELKEYTKMLQGVKNDISKKIRKQGITRDVIKSRSNVGYQLVSLSCGQEKES